MRIGRRIIIPAVLAVAVAGSTLAAAEMSAAITQASTGHAQVSAVSATPDTFYHG